METGVVVNGGVHMTDELHSDADKFDVQQGQYIKQGKME